MNIAELIKETVGFYNSNNRSTGIYGTGCKYLSDNGSMCAVGRCLKPEYLTEFHRVENDDECVTDIKSLMKHSFKNAQISEIVKEKYSEIKLDYWRSVQLLHDDSRNWDNNGLTKEGELFIKVEFGQEIFDLVFEQ